MKETHKQKGITLVALVITIIILLILAGITISSLTQTSLFGKANEAKEKTEEAKLRENTLLNEYAEGIDEIVGASGGQGSAESSTSTTHTPTNLTATYTWDEIADMAKVISNTNSINEDTLEVNVILNNETYTLGVGDTATVDTKTVRILGFNHDTLATPTAYGTTTATGKAGISFEYVDVITDNSGMNDSDTNSGGWGSCKLRTTLNGTVYNSLSIKNKIKEVQKEYISTYNDASSKTTCSDKLWLLSCGEIWDNGYGEGETRGYAIATEGSQYKYYKTTLGSTSYSYSTDITKKPNVSNSSAWRLRSPNFDFDSYFCLVSSDGSSSGYYASHSYMVAPGFSI